MKLFIKILSIALFFSIFLNYVTVRISTDSILIQQNSLIAQQDNSAWSDFYDNNIITKNTMPLEYRSLRLNLNIFKGILRSAPSESVSRVINSPLIIELPMPDGNFSRFYVTEYSMMEPELAAQFPEMKTYSIKGIDDPYATGKIDVTMLGFHAMVLTPNGDYFIDPVSSDESGIYISYFKSDFLSKYKFECLVTEMRRSTESFNADMTGQQLRSYRLACGATGEYTVFFGGTKPLGQAAIVTAINRVNGVFERDFSVRMVLIANNTSIVFTNPSTDPYTNDNGNTMLGENQTTCDGIIGSANYDIGHVFSTGGGGIASLGVVCFTGYKARGVTGLPSPVGDPFYIDYVAHEIGHQFSGNHSFNSCGGNRNAATAWEPGSGSTIMGYAGLCGAYDLQVNSDAYFHSGNVSEFVNFTQIGGGQLCGTVTNTGNTPPTVNVPSGGFTIPINTPFVLTGSATDNETPGSLTYCWEEFDLGPESPPNSPTGNAPIFRSFSPVVSPSRTFPKLSNLLNNTQTIGEILPSYTRSLSFRLTVRDNSAGGGGINFNSVSFNVNSGAGPFLVTSPNSNVNWSGTQAVTWNVANTTAAPVSCAQVSIKLSTDGGNTFPTTLAANTSNDGYEVVTLPDINTGLARMKVESVGNIFFDISNTNFTISPSVPAAALNFDGVNDYVALPNSLTTAATVGTAITIEYWYKGPYLRSAVRFQPTGGDYIVSGWGGLHIISTDGGLSGVSVGAGAEDGNWHHVAMTWKKNTVNGFKSYLDGNLIDQRNSANVNLPVMNSGGYLGSFLGIQEFMNGSLDQVRIWNRALEQWELQGFMNCEFPNQRPGLLAYYKFNHGFHGSVNTAVTSLTDYSGNNYNASLSNFTLTGLISNWFAPGGVTTGVNCGEYASSLNFDGVNDHINLGGGFGAAVANTTAITIEYWYKGSNNQSAVRFQDAIGNFIVAGWLGKHIISTDGGINGISQGAAVTDGNWHHVAMTWQKNTLNGFRSFLDGQLVEQRNSANVNLPPFGFLLLPSIGSYQGEQEFMQGTIDEVRIWNRALSQPEIQFSMNCEIPTSAPGLYANYHFNQGIAGANNSSVINLIDATGNGYNGFIWNFTMNGSTSNWTNPGGVVSGNSCIGGTYNITAVPEGFYNASTNRSNKKDTVRAYLCSNVSPFGVVDSAKTVMDSVTLTGSFIFPIAPSGTYYIQLKHRNSIETWSRFGGYDYFTGTVNSIDFTPSAITAFGNNLKQVDTSPVRFAIYSGDVNQDGTIDLTDIILCFNDANLFTSGYVNTDLTGDNFVDLTDITIAFNNSNAFVSKITP